MNRKDILKMEAGRELDELIGKVLFGRTYTDLPCGRRYYEGGWREESYFSTGISAAWEVVEKMREITYFRIGAFSNKAQLKNYVAWFDNKQASAPTAPEAICKAALLVVMEGAK